MKVELVIVVGAEDYYSGGQRHNKMMFAQAAVRYARIYAGRFDRTQVFYFKGKRSRSMTSTDGTAATGQTYFADGYTDGQIAAMKQSLANYGANVSEASSWSTIAAHINNTGMKIGGCQKRVQVIIFFAHGGPGRIWLSSSEGVYFQSGDLSALTGLLPETGLSGRRYGFRHATSWACQTGNIDAETATMDQRLSGSLAQAMANAWNLKVYASVTQTEYSATFSGGLAGRWKDAFGGRRIIDGVLWEDDGADGRVTSSTGGKGENLDQGMWVFNPGQRANYRTISLD
jgi:hypothetical protein